MFTEYCAQKDASAWFCGSRKGALPEAQKWEIVEAYCFEEPGQSRLAPTLREARVKSLVESSDASTKARGALCEHHRQVVPPLSLQFNHRKGEWSADDKGFESRRRKIEIDPVSRIPTAHLAGGDVVGVIVTETNPVLFMANRGEAKEDNIDQIKSLEQLLALMGSSLSGLVTDVAREAAKSGDRAAALGKLNTTESRRDWQALLNRDISKMSANLWEPVKRQEQDDAEVFLTDLATLRSWLTAAAPSQKLVKARLDSLLEHRMRLQLIAQQLESGPALLTGALDETLEKPGQWRDLFAKLAADAAKLPTLQDCEAVLDAFGGVVVAEPDKPVDVHAAAIRFRQLFQPLTPGAGGEGAPCPGLTYVPRLQESVQQVYDAARAAARSPDDPALAKALREQQADARERHLQHALVLARFARQISALKQSFKDTIGKEEETRKAALVLGLIADRIRDAAFRRDLTSDAWVVTNRIFVQEEVYSSKWSKVRTSPLKITLNSPIADSVPNDRAKETTTSYRFVRKGFDRLTFGAGLLYTNSYSASYGVIDRDPSTNETTTTTTTTGGPPPAPVETTQVSRPELKEIVEKDRQPRAGSYALFVNYRLLGSSSAGLGGQVGVGTSADNPAFLGGASIHLTPYVTVGVGGGKFRVKRLDAAQRGADVRVATADEIRVNNTWDGAGYVSISINLSGLPLFK